MRAQSVDEPSRVTRSDATADEQLVEAALGRIVANVLDSEGDLLRDCVDDLALAVAWIVQTRAVPGELAEYLDRVAVQACGEADYGRAMRTSWTIAGVILRYAAVMDGDTRRRLLRDEDGRRVVEGMKARSDRRGQRQGQPPCKQARCRPRARRPRRRTRRPARAGPSGDDSDGEGEPPGVAPGGDQPALIRRAEFLHRRTFDGRHGASIPVVVGR